MGRGGQSLHVRELEPQVDLRKIFIKQVWLLVYVVKTLSVTQENYGQVN